MKGGSKGEARDSREAVAGRQEATPRRETFGEGSRNGERSRGRYETRETNDGTVFRFVAEWSGENKNTQAKNRGEKLGHGCVSETSDSTVARFVVCLSDKNGSTQVKRGGEWASVAFPDGIRRGDYRCESEVIETSILRVRREEGECQENECECCHAGDEPARRQ